MSEMGRRKEKVPRVSRRTVANLRPEIVVMVPRRPWRGPVRTWTLSWSWGRVSVYSTGPSASVKMSRRRWISQSGTRAKAVWPLAVGEAEGSMT